MNDIKLNMGEILKQEVPSKLQKIRGKAQLLEMCMNIPFTENKQNVSGQCCSLVGTIHIQAGRSSDHLEAHTCEKAVPS